MRGPSSRARLVGLAACVAGACSAPSAGTSRAPATVPERWNAALPSAGAEPARAEPWWATFASAELDALVAEALAANRDLGISVARLRAAESSARIAAGARRPTAELDASARRQKQIFVGLPVPGGDVLESLSTSYGVSLALEWELDLWGRLAAEARAAQGELVASAADLAAARLSLAGQAVKAWLAWQEARLAGELARRTLASWERSAESVRRRFAEARASALDLRLAEANVADARALVESRAADEASAVRQLELLLGRHPSGAVLGAAELPDLPATPAAGMPSELLARRPDLIAAQARLAASDARLDAARAALYPRLRLTGSVGRTSDEAGDLLDSDFGIWSIAGALAQPLFEGGRLRAGVDLADARVAEAVASFESSWLKALGEVETQLANERTLARLELEQERASAAAGAAADSAQERYDAGLEPLLTVLDAQRRALDAETRRIGVRGRRLTARVDLHLALGGGFEPTENAEPPEEPR